MKKIKHYINRYFYHKTQRMLPSLDGGTGACGQDVLVAQLLNNKHQGVFIDIGANDGVKISNTAFLESQLQWSGVAVEPIPTVFEKLKANRKCDAVNVCVTPLPGKAKFLELVDGSDMLSTLATHNTGLTARRLKKNAKRHGAQIRELDVECVTFDSLVKDYSIKEVDFLSIDTEGGELDILKSINFEKTPVKVISVENNYYTNKIRKFLETKGFIYLGTFKVDEIYVFGGEHLRKSMQDELSSS